MRLFVVVQMIAFQGTLQGMRYQYLFLKVIHEWAGVVDAQLFAKAGSAHSKISTYLPPASSFWAGRGATIQGVLAYLTSESMISNANRISGADSNVLHPPLGKMLLAERNPVCPSSSLPRYALLSQNDVCDTFWNGASLGRTHVRVRPDILLISERVGERWALTLCMAQLYCYIWC